MGTFGVLLREQRGNRTQQHLARTLGYSVPYISSLENGKKSPTREFVDKLVEVERLTPELATALYQSAGFEPTPLDQSIPEINNLIRDPSLSPVVREHLRKDLVTLAQCWIAYQRAKDEHYNRAAELSLATSAEALQELHRLHGRLTAYLLDTQASVNLQQAQFDAAKAAQNAAEPYIAVANDPYIAALTLMHQGDNCRETSLWVAAENNYLQARRLFRSMKRDLEEARCAHKQAITLLYQGNWRKAQELLLYCEERFKDQGDEFEQIKLIYTLGWLCNTSGQRDKAHEYHAEGLRRSRTFRTRHNEEDDYLIILGTSGIAHDAYHRREIGDEFEAHVAETEMRARKIGDKRSLGFLYLLKARAASYLARRAASEDEADALAKQAEDYFTKSRSYLDATHYHYRLAVTLVFYGQHLLTRNEHAAAKVALTDALITMREMGSQYYQAMALTLLCRLHLQTKHYEAIEPRAREIEALHERHTYLDIMGQLRCIESRVLLAHGDIVKGAERLAEAFRFSMDYHEQSVNELLPDLIDIVEQFQTQTRSTVEKRQLFREVFLAACDDAATKAQPSSKKRWSTTLPDLRRITAPLKSQYI